jgi:hypothetical protein
MIPRRYKCPICKLHHPRRGDRRHCTAAPRDRTWPTQPIFDRLRLGDHQATADALGVDATALRKWGHSGLSDVMADRLATRLGVHPTALWGWEWIDCALSVVDRQRIEGGWRQAWEWAQNASDPASGPDYQGTPSEAAESDTGGNPAPVATKEQAA